MLPLLIVAKLVPFGSITTPRWMIPVDAGVSVGAAVNFTWFCAVPKAVSLWKTKTPVLPTTFEAKPENVSKLCAEQRY